MNSCCTQPVEVIAADQHHGESCCLITEKTPAPARAVCPVSGTLSRQVQRRTLEHLLKPERIDSIQKVQYYYCKEPICDVVYFSNDNAPFFTTNDVAVKVFAKDQGAEVPVCYCFDWTRGRIKQQISETGQSTAAVEIAREIKAGHCMCDIKNPKGECCLGDVNLFVKEVLAHPRKEAQHDFKERETTPAHRAAADSCASRSRIPLLVQSQPCRLFNGERHGASACRSARVCFFKKYV